MAQLKDTTISGSLNVSDTIVCDQLQINETTIDSDGALTFSRPYSNTALRQFWPIRTTSSYTYYSFYDNDNSTYVGKYIGTSNIYENGPRFDNGLHLVVTPDTRSDSDMATIHISYASSLSDRYASLLGTITFYGTAFLSLTMGFESDDANDDYFVRASLTYKPGPTQAYTIKSNNIYVGSNRASRTYVRIEAYDSMISGFLSSAN